MKYSKTFNLPFRREEVRQKVYELIESKLLPDITLQDGLKLSDDLGADSLDGVEIIMELERMFNIEIADEDAENIITIGDIIEYLTPIREQRRLKLNKIQNANRK